MCEKKSEKSTGTKMQTLGEESKIIWLKPFVLWLLTSFHWYICSKSKLHASYRPTKAGLSQGEMAIIKD